MSMISILVTDAQSSPPSFRPEIGLLAGIKSSRYGCSRSTESWPLRFPVNSWQRAGGTLEISAKVSAAASSIIRCLSFLPRLDPKLLMAS